MSTLIGGLSGHDNNNNNNNSDSRKSLSALKIISLFGFWTLLAVVCYFGCPAVSVVHGAAVYSNLNFLANPHFKPLCSAQQEHFIESDGKESSLILEFNPGVLAEKRKSCTRILSAPSNYGFIVRLILPKIRHGTHHTNSATSTPLSAASTTAKDGESESDDASDLNEMSSLFIDKLNSTALKSVGVARGRTCPLSIFSSLDPHTPQWRVDPCQLEDTAPEMEDPVRLFHGRVRIVWEHGRNTLKSKLMVTSLGKGEQCRNENKHPCLQIGDEPILCISKDLVCDGIRHCPYSNEYDSDEDYTMCWKRRRFGEPIPPPMESDIFEHFALEVFRNLFAYDSPSVPVIPSTASPVTTTTVPPAAADFNRTTLHKVDPKLTASLDDSAKDSTAATPKIENTTEAMGGHHRRNSTRMGLNSDLSKYGPWGYLMLGMLLCGGALLICGLWASASQHAANNEREAALAAGGAGSSIDHPSSNGAPPNYEELDPPPAYSVLFPNQKAASSTTLNSLGATTAAGSLPPLSPSAAPSSHTTAIIAAVPNTSTATNSAAAMHMPTQMEIATASSSQHTQRQTEGN